MKRKAIITIILIILIGYIFYLHSDPKVKISSPNAEYTTEKNIDVNKIHYLQNIPIVYITNNGYQAGLQHGKLLKKQINEVVKILNNKILEKNTIKGFLVDTYLLQKSKQLDKYIPQTYREEMKGIADGADVSYNDILLINTYDDLLYLTGCSSIAISKNEKNKTLIHARNLDYPIDILSDKNIIFHYLAKQFISVGFPGYIGVLSGTNYDGITLSSHTVLVAENQMGVPSGIVYRQIMENAKDIKNVEKILNDNRKTIANNLIVSSLNENKTAAFEITSNKVITKLEDNHSVATNHFTNEEFSTINKPTPNSKKRYDYLNNFFNNTDNIDANKIIETMSFYDGNQSGWSSVANQGTVQSAIFLPEQKIIYVAKGTKPPVTQDGYVEYGYKKFLAE